MGPHHKARWELGCRIKMVPNEKDWRLNRIRKASLCVEYFDYLLGSAHNRKLFKIFFQIFHIFFSFTIFLFRFGQKKEKHLKKCVL